MKLVRKYKDMTIPELRKNKKIYAVCSALTAILGGTASIGIVIIGPRTISLLAVALGLFGIAVGVASAYSSMMTDANLELRVREIKAEILEGKQT